MLGIYTLMAQGAKSFCTHPSCGKILPKGQSRCKKHEYKRVLVDSRNDKQDHQSLYDLRRWRRLRAAHISAHPLCASCFKRDRIVEAKVVDHITPHLGNEKIFFDPKNLQSLCFSCHNRKTSKYDGGFGNRKKRRRKT